MNKFIKLALSAMLIAISSLLFAGPQKDCVGLLRSVKRVEIASHVGHVKSALLKIGVKSADVAEFFNKQMVAFEFPTEGGDPVFGFVKFSEGHLVSQIFSIKNENPKAAFSAFERFRRDSMFLADRLGANTIEIQGGSVINSRVIKFLIKRGFEIKQVEIPPYFGGGGQQEVYYKVFQIREE